MESTAKNPVVHFEVLGRDAGALQKFYSDAFGWPMSSPEGPMEYAMVHPEGGNGIAGGIGKAPQGGGHVTFYVGVADPGATLERIEQLGGRTVEPPTEIPGGVTFATFADPEGHVVGLVRE